MAEPNIPWDIYIDERKVHLDYALGILVVPNTPSFMHKLWRYRYISDGVGGHKHENHEIHWHDPRRDTLPVVEKWIYTVFQHRGVRFYRVPIAPRQSKMVAVLNFITKFCEKRGLVEPFNVVAFLDFDNEHANCDLQNHVRQITGIARCYHLDSRNNDCIQCCDLLLGATSLLWSDPTIVLEYPSLKDVVIKHNRLSDGKIKRYIAGFLACHIDANGRRVYDLRKRSGKPDIIN